MLSLCLTDTQTDKPGGTPNMSPIGCMWQKCPSGFMALRGPSQKDYSMPLAHAHSGTTTFNIIFNHNLSHPIMHQINSCAVGDDKHKQKYMNIISCSNYRCTWTMHGHMVHSEIKLFIIM